MGAKSALSAEKRQQQQQSTLARRLVCLAACARAAYLLLVVGCAHLIRDYDTSASLLSESCADNWPQEAAAAQQYMPGVVWDSVFLHRVAACGYEYEQFFAFYPGLPGMTQLFSCNQVGRTEQAQLQAVFGTAAGENCAARKVVPACPRALLRWLLVAQCWCG